MNNNNKSWFQHYLMLFEESKSFKCAQRLWLMSYHFNIPLPQDVLDKFVDGIIKADATWDAPGSRYQEDFVMAQFIGDHMRQQKREKGKATKAAAIDAYVEMMVLKHDIELDAKTVEKRLERLSDFMKEIDNR